MEAVEGRTEGRRTRRGSKGREEEMRSGNERKSMLR